MPLKFYYIFFIFIFSSFYATAQPDNETMVLAYDRGISNYSSDTLGYKESEQTQRFYDSLKSKTSKSAFTRLIYSSLFRNPPAALETGGLFVDESEKYRPYEGRMIGDIVIQRQQIYEKGVRGMRRYANAVHMLTRENTIKSDLLFKVGERVEAEKIVRNMQILRSRDYLADVAINIVPKDNDSTMVDIIVSTHDRWTISMDGAWRKEGRTMVEVFDANFLGLGNKLSVKTYFDRRDFGYEGNEFEYKVTNLFGTFYKADFKFGKAFEDRTLLSRVYKEFILPADYQVGISYVDLTNKYYQLYADTSDMLKVRRIDTWAGKSFYIKPLKSSIYITSRYAHSHFRERPEKPLPVGPDTNPAFHNYDDALFGLGFYREKLYTTNMLYGFGNKEYLAAGYKAELVTGYSWGEFSNDIYLGVDLKKSGLSPAGYFAGTVTLGSYVDPHKGTWWRSGIDVDARWVSNLWSPGLNRIRQFISLNYTKGWNRGQGNNEVITFTSRNGLRTLDEWLIGTSRLLLNTETVVFTPFQPLGFRITLFGFADFGTLGFDPNPFNNPFYSTLGLGIRFRNERLVFKAIQLRFGIALGKGGLIHNQYIRLSNQHTMERYRLRPTMPEIVGFK